MEFVIPSPGELLSATLEHFLEYRTARLRESANRRESILGRTKEIIIGMHDSVLQHPHLFLAPEQRQMMALLGTHCLGIENTDETEEIRMIKYFESRKRASLTMKFQEGKIGHLYIAPSVNVLWNTSLDIPVNFFLCGKQSKVAFLRTRADIPGLDVLVSPCPLVIPQQLVELAPAMLISNPRIDFYGGERVRLERKSALTGSPLVSQYHHVVDFCDKEPALHLYVRNSALR